MFLFLLATSAATAFSEHVHVHRRDCGAEPLQVQAIHPQMQAVSPCQQAVQPQLQAVSPCQQAVQPQYQPVQVQAVQPCAQAQPMQVQAVQPQPIAISPCQPQPQPMMFQQAAAYPPAYPPASPIYYQQPQQQPQPQYYQPQPQYIQFPPIPLPYINPADLEEEAGCYNRLGNSLASSVGRIMRYVACPWSFLAENVECSGDDSSPYGGYGGYYMPPAQPAPQYFQPAPQPIPQPAPQPQPMYYPQPAPQPQPQPQPQPMYYPQPQQPQGQWFTTVVPVQSTQNSVLQPVHASLVPDYGLPNNYYVAAC